jgi:hypothetical protein
MNCLLSLRGRGALVVLGCWKWLVLYKTMLASMTDLSGKVVVVFRLEELLGILEELAGAFCNLAGLEFRHGLGGGILRPPFFEGHFAFVLLVLEPFASAAFVVTSWLSRVVLGLPFCTVSGSRLGPRVVFSGLVNRSVPSGLVNGSVPSIGGWSTPVVTSRCVDCAVSLVLEFCVSAITSPSLMDLLLGIAECFGQSFIHITLKETYVTPVVLCLSGRGSRSPRPRPRPPRPLPRSPRSPRSPLKGRSPRSPRLTFETRGCRR